MTNSTLHIQHLDILDSAGNFVLVSFSNGAVIQLEAAKVKELALKEGVAYLEDSTVEN